MALRFGSPRSLLEIGQSTFMLGSGEHRDGHHGRERRDRVLGTGPCGGQARVSSPGAAGQPGGDVPAHEQPPFTSPVLLSRHQHDPLLALTRMPLPNHLG